MTMWFLHRKRLLQVMQTVRRANNAKESEGVDEVDPSSSSCSTCSVNGNVHATGESWHANKNGLLR